MLVISIRVFKFLISIKFHCVYVMDDVRENIEYDGYNATSPIILFLWEVVQSFNLEYRAHPLQFVVGSSKVMILLVCGLHNIMYL